MSKKSGLGRGIGALINDENNLKNLIGETKPGESVVEISLSEIKANPYQPRKSFNEDELRGLAESIKEQGLLQPIVVRKVNNEYELVAGERRLRAAKIAGLEKIGALVRNYSNEESMNLALLENLQRTDLNPMEVAEAYKRLMKEGGMTQEELSKKLGVKRSSVANTLRLLNLPEVVQNYVRTEKMSETGARAIAGLPDFEAMASMAKEAVENGWSVRNIENSVATWKNKGAEEDQEKKVKVTKKIASVSKQDANLGKFIQNLEQACGEKVEIVAAKGGKGEVIGFKFVTQEDLQRVCSVLSKLFPEKKIFTGNNFNKNFSV